MAVAEKKESFWKRHLVALILGGFAVLLLVIVAGQLLDKGDISKWLAEVPEQWAYVLTFLFVWFDAVIPIFPGETTLSAASTIAAGGGLTLGLDHGGRRARRDRRRHVAVLDRPHEHSQDATSPRQGARESEGAHRLGEPRALSRSPDRRRALRPRDAVRRQCVHGAVQDPYRRFLAWSILSGVLWSVYTCALAYWVSTTLAGFPLASLVISSLITSGALAAVYFVEKHKIKRAKGAEPTDASAEPAIPSSTAGSKS